MVRTVIGVDVGGTKMLGLVVDALTNEILARRQVPTPKGDPTTVLPALTDCIAAMVDETGRPEAIGVGLPGLVDRFGVLHYGPNVPGVIGLDASVPIRDRFDVPVRVGNDANGAAVAEHRLGVGRGVDHLVMVTQGTGIGGGLIVEGRLLTGANGFAGEPGHMLVRAGGHRCACGQLGCWEAYASGAGLSNLTRELTETGRAGGIVERAGGIIDHVRGEHVAEALAAGDPDALEVLDRFGDWVARGLGSLINLLDPELIVLGGGLSVISEWFLDAVQAKVMAASLGGPFRPRVRVVAAALGPDAGALGAALLALPDR